MKRFEVAGVTYPLPVLLGVLKERKKNNKDEGGAKEKEKNDQKPIATWRKPKQPTAIIKRATIDSSDLRIEHVNIKMVAFRRDLHIRGLRSTIGATDQKVKF
jgi:hypothetical protein